MATKVDCWYFVMGVADDGALERGVGVSVQKWHTTVKRTAIHGFRALFSSGLGIRVTTRRVASHCARCSRFARGHSTLCGTSAWLGLFPLA